MGSQCRSSKSSTRRQLLQAIRIGVVGSAVPQPMWKAVALGPYQLCPGKPEYTLGAPLFDRVVLHLPGDTSTVIEAQDQSLNGFYVSSVLLDGKSFDSPTLRHVDLIRGIHRISKCVRSVCSSRYT